MSTFDFQVHVILIDAERIPRRAGVLSAIPRLSHTDFQSAVVVLLIRLVVERAETTLLEPETEAAISLVIFHRTLALPVQGSLTHQVIFGMGEPKEVHSSRAR